MSKYTVQNLSIEALNLEGNIREDYGDITALAASMEATGGPVELPRVTPMDEGHYRVVAGHRRIVALKQSGAKTVTVLVGPAVDEKTYVLQQLASNTDRKSLTPIEEARAFALLVKMCGSQESVAKLRGISQSQVSQRLKLLQLDPEVQQAIHKGLISASGAEQLCRLLPEQQREILPRILDPGSGVRPVSAIRAIVEEELLKAALDQEAQRNIRARATARANGADGQNHRAPRAATAQTGDPLVEIALALLEEVLRTLDEVWTGYTFQKATNEERERARSLCEKIIGLAKQIADGTNSRCK